MACFFFSLTCGILAIELSSFCRDCFADFSVGMWREEGSKSRYERSSDTLVPPAIAVPHCLFLRSCVCVCVFPMHEEGKTKRALDEEAEAGESETAGFSASQKKARWEAETQNEETVDAATRKALGQAAIAVLKKVRSEMKG